MPGQEINDEPKFQFNESAEIDRQTVRIEKNRERDPDLQAVGVGRVGGWTEGGSTCWAHQCTERCAAS